MEASAGRFAAFYAGPVQHPLLLWLAAGAALAYCRLRPGLSPSLRRYCTALGMLSLCDAWLTAPHVYGLGTLPSSLATVVPLAFVLLGDFRYFLLLTAGTAGGGLAVDAARAARAAGLTLIVPLATQAMLRSLPDSLDLPRVMFLTYEVAFVCLTGALLRWHASVRALPWLRSVSRFVALYYALWAGADAVLLLTGADAGFLLRVLPNLLYYGGLVAAIGWFAPKRPRPLAPPA